MIFDYALALSMARAAGLFAGEKAKIPTLLIVLTLPTVLINGACWGQCDAMYMFFIVINHAYRVVPPQHAPSTLSRAGRRRSASPQRGLSASVVIASEAIISITAEEF